MEILKHVRITPIWLNENIPAELYLDSVSYDISKTEEFVELEKAVQPAKEFLKKHYAPHCLAVITIEGVKVLSTEISSPL